MARSFKKGLVDVIKYLITLGIAAFLIWYVYGDFSFDALLERILQINFFWIILSIFIALLSHYLRAYRWNILLKPLGNEHLTVYRTFLAVLVGYFANNLVPRMGEVTRCGILKKTDNVNMTSSLGSVVAERALDMIILIIVIIFTFFIEFDKLSRFALDNFGDKIPDTNTLVNYTIIAVLSGIVLLFVLFLLYRYLKSRFHRNPIYIKIRTFIRELIEGFLSIRKIKNKWGFWLSTLGIWVLYYLIPFVVFYAMPTTSNLDIFAGLSVLVMSGIGMSAPVQGGIGVFHILVGRVLILYNVLKDDGEIFALILHSTHFITVMIFGGISFIITVFLKRRNNSDEIATKN